MSIETQLAIKRNAEELSSYLKDLNSWTNEIKKKDVLAKKTKIKKHNYPPIRNTGRIDSNSPPSSRPSSPMPEEKSTQNDKKSIQKEVKKERIKSYDYRSWDKYNVEEELEKLENEDYKEPKPMVEEKENNDETNQEAIELSLIEKEKGNIMFKKGNYKRAIQYYTKSKELDPTNPVFPLNRAMAYLKLKKYSEAENDCTDCIALAPKNVKALYRRGLARVGLKKYLEAKTDFEAAVVLEPSNKQAKDELNKVLNILKPKPKPKEESKSSSPINNNNSSSVTSKSKSNQLKKKKSTITKEQEEKLKNKPIRRRLEITEVGRSQEEIQKEKEEELLKQMNEDIKEINELMNSTENNNKLEEITLTDNTKEESIQPLDMVPVSTKKKVDNNSNKKPSKKIEIMEKDEIEELKLNDVKQKEQTDKKEIIEEIKTPSVKENKKKNELLSGSNDKSTLLSSFILNKEDKEKNENNINQSKEPSKINETKDQKKSSLNKKRSIVIEEVDEIIGEHTSKPLNSISEITTNNVYNENSKVNTNNNTSSKIEIIEEIKEEKDDKNDKIKEISNDKISEVKKEEIIEEINETTSEKVLKIEPSKKIRPKVKVATTMYDFERDWKSMRNDDQKTFEYLSSIIPENLPSLFKNSFESDYFTRILVIMNKFYIKEEMYNEMYALLNSIQKVNRFEMTLMFMTRKDKQALNNVFDAMKTNQSNSSYSISNLESLAKAYKISL